MRANQKFNKDVQFCHASPGLSLEFWDEISFLKRWEYCSQAFRIIERQNSKFQLHAFVMMSTHFHLLYSCNHLEDQYIMEEFDRALLGLIRSQARDLSKFIALTAFDHPIIVETISSYQQLLNTYRYIYRNPVEAGLCSQTEGYIFSTLREVMGRAQNLMNSMDLLHVIQNPVKILGWLNAQETHRLYEGGHRLIKD